MELAIRIMVSLILGFLITSMIKFLWCGSRYFEEKLYQMKHKEVCDACYKKLKDLSEVKKS